jgi:hypothetical protein
MIFQERDAEILRWINGFGFASAEQISGFMKVSGAATYLRIKKLVEGGYLARDRVLHGQARIHKVTKQGITASGDALPPVTDVHMGTFRHDFMLVDLALMLEAQTGGVFTPDRRLRHNEGLSGGGLSGHVADGYVHIGEDKPIAIELELSLKSRARIRSIVNEYGGNLGVKEVWYYTDRSDVARAIEQAADGFSFIKVRKLTDASRRKEEAA